MVHNPVSSYILKYALDLSEQEDICDNIPNEDINGKYLSIHKLYDNYLSYYYKNNSKQDKINKDLIDLLLLILKLMMMLKRKVDFNESIT